MLITFREIQRRVQARIQNTSTSTTNDNDLLPKIKDWVNERYDRIYRSFPFPGTTETYDLTLTASQVEYIFDRNVFKVWGIFDKTNGFPIKKDTIQNHILHHAIDLDVTNNILADDPTRWRPVGTFTVKAEIVSAEKVTVVSTSASDISPNVVRVSGLVNGVILGENIVLTGTSSAASTNTYDANQKLKISIGTSDQTRKTVVGKITVTGQTSSTVYAQVSPQEFAHEYHWFRVSPTPKASGTQPTWEIWHSLPIEFLVNDNDIPIYDCCDELVQGTFADALREDGLEQEATIAEEKFVSMVKELQEKNVDLNEVQQFIPSNSNSIKMLDYYRMVNL